MHEGSHRCVSLAAKMPTEPASSETFTKGDERSAVGMESSDEDDDTAVTFQTEVKQWSLINRHLKQHGISPVTIYHPKQVTSSTEGVFLDLPTSKALRRGVLGLITSLKHKTELSRDLAATNAGLQREVAEHADLCDKYQAKVKDLKVMLECSRARVKELEEGGGLRLGQLEEEGERLTNTKMAATAKVRQLQAQLLGQEAEMEKLQKKLRKYAEQEEHRTARQNEVFQEFKKRTARVHSAMDQKLLDIIDAYESQIVELQNELDMYRENSDDIISSRVADRPKNSKGVLKTYERQLRQANKKIKELEEEVELLKLDMGSRPQLKDYRVTALRVKKLEKLLALHNISIPGEKSKADPFRHKRKYSSQLEDLDFLPLDFCQQYLRDLCAETGVGDLEQLVPAVQRIRDSAAATVPVDNPHEEFCLQVVRTLEAHEGGEGLRRSVKKHGPLAPSTLRRSLAVLENWHRDLSSMQELQLTLNSLLEKLVPWAKIRFTEDHHLVDMIEIIDNLVYDETTCKEDGGEHPSRSAMEGVIEHFQMLFDVTSIAGMYPRMNDIYTKLGEVHNVMRTLKTLLGLEEDAKSSAVVDAVARLCNIHDLKTSEQLRELLQVENLDGVIRRLEEHEAFFPAFNEMVQKLLTILGVQRIDQIVPAVRALKLLSG